MIELSGNNSEKTEVKRKSALERRIEQAKARLTSTTAASMHAERTQQREQRAEENNVLIAERLKSVELQHALKKEDFFIICMEHFCRTIDDDYIPAELGVIKYSLKDGVQTQLHMYINPGKIPVGLNFEANRHANKTHQLPTPPFALGLTDYNEIAEKLLCFLDAKEENQLQLFTDANGVLPVENMIKAILGNRIEKIELHVCSLPELFFRLQRSVQSHDMSMPVFPNVRKAQYTLDLDCFSFTSGISCKYHETNFLLNECALSQCIRWAYTISEHCCRPLGINLIPGKHCPATTKSVNVPFFDDDSSYDGEEKDDVVSFVSFATGYTSMLSAEVLSYYGDVDAMDSQSVCDRADVESIVSDMTVVNQDTPILACRKSLRFEEPEPKFNSGTLKYKQCTLKPLGRALLFGDSNGSKKYVSKYPSDGYTYHMEEH
uniref:Maelstrom domain-containing protein n=1 Tax=Anopheles culicifacies TaxID=139723 RepID=A0A182MX82_9DIPT